MIKIIVSFVIGALIFGSSSTVATQLIERPFIVEVHTDICTTENKELMPLLERDFDSVMDMLK